MKTAKKVLAFMLVCAVAFSAFSGCGNTTQNNAEDEKIYYENEVHIVLSDEGITADGKAVTAESEKVHISNDVIYYEDKDSYESGNPYGEGTDSDKHSAEEAAKVTVVNITERGIYRLSGSLSHGQIRIDLGENAKEDEEAVVTLVLDGLDINCDVAPAVIFMNVYECDGDWSAETAASDVDTTDAGANVIIADGSTNNVEGAYVARIYKDKEEEKKLWKQDGAFYSYMSMNVDGEPKESGVLNIKADNEGLDSELHLTINGGNINIFADNDGINTNEDGVSVTTINGGNIHIIAGLGAEGDGVDSNGWLVINGGTVIASANPASDAGLDSDLGSFINGGTVVALGSTMDWAESDSNQVTMNLQFAQHKAADSAIIITKEDGSVVFAYDPSEDEVVGSNIRQFMGAVVSCPQFAVGDSYNVYIGAVNGSETNGIYDVSTITSVDGVQQAYSGTDVRGHGGMGGGKPAMNGEMPEGMMPPHMTEGEEFDPEMMKPDFERGEKPQMPEGMAPPEDFEPATDENGTPAGFDGEGQFDFENGEKPQMPQGDRENGAFQPAAANTEFYMQDKVNNFSGVSDY